MKALVVVINILASLAILPALYMAMFSPMLFDSGASGRTWALFYTVLAIPASLVLTQIASWVFFARSAYSWALGVSLIPLVFVVLLLVLFLTGSKGG